MNSENTVRYHCYVNLIGFSCDDAINLGDVIIRNYSIEDVDEVKDLVIRNVVDFHPTALKFLDNPTILKQWGMGSIIEFPLSFQAIGPVGNRPSVEFAKVIISFLRLYKSGGIGANYLSSRILEHPSGMTGTVTSPLYMTVERTKNYELIKGDTDLLINFYKKYKEKIVNAQKQVKRSIKWFNKAYADVEREDKLIDLIVSLESLYKITGYRLCLRCAYNLAKNNEDCERIFTVMKNAVDERNRIIHGGSSLNATVKEIFQDVEEFTRQSILKFLDSNDQDLIRLLDKKIERSSLVNDY